MLIFSYGSNLCVRRLRRRVASARPVYRGWVRGRQLRFHKRSNVDDSGKADAFSTGGPDDRVWGAVYRIDPAHKGELDRIEGLGNGYREEWVQVAVDAPLDGSGPESPDTVEAQVYVATAIDDALKPFHWYKRYVLEGARQHGLPDDYVRDITAVEAVPDPDRERAREHRELSC